MTLGFGSGGPGGWCAVELSLKWGQKEEQVRKGRGGALASSPCLWWVQLDCESHEAGLGLSCSCVPQGAAQRGAHSVFAGVGVGGREEGGKEKRWEGEK